MNPPNRSELMKMVEEAAKEHNDWQEPNEMSAHDSFIEGSKLIIDGPLAEADKRIEELEKVDLHSAHERIKDLEKYYNEKLAEADKTITDLRAEWSNLVEATKAEHELRLEFEMDSKRLDFYFSSKYRIEHDKHGYFWENEAPHMINYNSPRDAIDAKMKEGK